MKSVTTYIHFDGNCREAMSFYQQCFGGDLQLTPYADAGGAPSTDPAGKIMHSQLSPTGTPVLMASDGTPGGAWQAGNNFSVSIDCDTIEEIEKLFAALADKGQIRLPLSNMPWGARFGMLTDQFGVQWLLSCAVA